MWMGCSQNGAPHMRSFGIVKTLFTSTSSRPASSRTRPNSVSTAASSAWSTCTATPWPPRRSISSAVARRDSSPSRVRPVTYTRMPASPRARATPLPTPRLAPVTTATFRSSLMGAVLPRLRRPLTLGPPWVPSEMEGAPWQPLPPRRPMIRRLDDRPVYPNPHPIRAEPNTSAAASTRRVHLIAMIPPIRRSSRCLWARYAPGSGMHRPTTGRRRSGAQAQTSSASASAFGACSMISS